MKVVGFRFFLEEPLLGHGLGTTRQFLGGTYFHDNYIQLLYETGITGLGLYLAVLLSVFIKALKAKCHLAALYIAFILLYGIFDVTYHNKLFYIMLALAIVLTKRKEKRFSCESLTYHTSG